MGAGYLQTLQKVSQSVSLPAHAGSSLLQHDLSLLGPSSQVHAPLMHVEADEQLEPDDELPPDDEPPPDEPPDDEPPPLAPDEELELEEELVPLELQPTVDTRARTKREPRSRIKMPFGARPPWSAPSWARAVPLSSSTRNGRRS